MINVIANLKGGTGKSTVTFNLAVWLESTECRATVIDLDPQRTLSDVAALRMEEGMEPSLSVEAGPFSDVTFPKGAEEIIIDVGTADLESFKQAIMIADRILIPVTPSQADIWSTQRFIRFVYKNTHGNPPDSIAFINRADTNKAIQASDEAAAALNALPGVRLMSQRLSDRAVYRDSFSESLSVFELEPRSVASREFKAFAEALFGRSKRSVLDRLRKQKSSTVADSAFRLALETPSGEPSVTQKIGKGNVVQTSADGTVRDQRGQDKLDNKKRKTRKGKKLRKALKEKRGGKNKKAKGYKKVNTTKEGKKRKKGKKGKKRS